MQNRAQRGRSAVELIHDKKGAAQHGAQKRKRKCAQRRTGCRRCILVSFCFRFESLLGATVRSAPKREKKIFPDLMRLAVIKRARTCEAKPNNQDTAKHDSVLLQERQTRSTLVLCFLHFQSGVQQPQLWRGLFMLLLSVRLASLLGGRRRSCDLGHGLLRRSTLTIPSMPFVCQGSFKGRLSTHLPRLSIVHGSRGAGEALAAQSGVGTFAFCRASSVRT